jgi:hypothetical protein
MCLRKTSVCLRKTSVRVRKTFIRIKMPVKTHSTGHILLIYKTVNKVKHYERPRLKIKKKLFRCYEPGQRALNIKTTERHLHVNIGRL